MQATSFGSDLESVLKQTQAGDLLQERLDATPPLIRAMRVHLIRRAIRKGQYETAERLDAAAEKLIRNLSEETPVNQRRPGELE